MAEVTQGNTVYTGVANAGALKADRTAGTQLWQLDTATGQLVPAGSSGTKGDKGYYTEDTSATSSLQSQQAATATANANAQAQSASQGTQFNSASQQLNSFLQSIPGLAQLDPTNQLGAWLTSQSQTLAGQGLSASDITSSLEATINNPLASGDAQAQQVFDQLFPGYNEKIQNGTSNANGSYTGIAGYIAYSSQLQQYAQVADLTPNTLNAQTVGQLWANNVSASEVSSRITQGYVEASNLWNNEPGFAQFMTTNYGMTQGGLASYYLNPTNAVSDLTLQQQLNSGVTAGAAVQQGFGNLAQSQAAALSAFLGGTNTSGLGGGPAVSEQTAQGFFQQGIGGGASGVNALTVAQAGAGLTSGPGANLTADQIIAAGEGNAQANQAVSNVQQTRTMNSRGGGGAATTAQGAVGLGYAQS
jgi:hypothetical protein